MAASAHNTEWDRVLAERLARKRDEDAREAASALRPPGRAGRARAPSGDEAAAETLLWSGSTGPAGPPSSREPSGRASPEPGEHGRRARGATSAEMVVEDLKRRLRPSDEKKALDILLRRRGPGRGGAILVLGAVTALVAAGGVLFELRRPSGEGALRLAGDAPSAATRDVGPPREDRERLLREASPAAGAVGSEGDPKRPDELPTFHARVPRPGAARPSRRTEWIELGGPFVDLDASPPLR